MANSTNEDVFIKSWEASAGVKRTTYQLFLSELRDITKGTNYTCG